MWMFGSRTTVKKVRNSLTWFRRPAEAWLAAYGAHIIPNFSQEHCTALVDPQVIRRFHAEVVTPLNDRHDTEAIFQCFHNVLSAQQLTINWTIVMPRHRTSHTSEPPEDDLVKVLPRTSYPALPTGSIILSRKLTT